MSPELTRFAELESVLEKAVVCPWALPPHEEVAIRSSYADLVEWMIIELRKPPFMKEFFD